MNRIIVREIYEKLNITTLLSISFNFPKYYDISINLCDGRIDSFQKRIKRPGDYGFIRGCIKSIKSRDIRSIWAQYLFNLASYRYNEYLMRQINDLIDEDIIDIDKNEAAYWAGLGGQYLVTPMHMSDGELDRYFDGVCKAGWMKSLVIPSFFGSIKIKRCMYAAIDGEQTDIILYLNLFNMFTSDEIQHFINYARQMDKNISLSVLLKL